MASSIPTPDEAEQVFFLLRWWRELTLGLIALLSSVALVKKGRNVDTVPIYLSDKEIQKSLDTVQDSLSKDMQLCRFEIENSLRAEFYTAMHDNNADLIVRFKELLDAHET